ncbi:hypothetical protein BDZ89DRAFT_960761, partial [Hymenopellis radicata]
PDESVFSRWLREEVFVPEKLPGNISIAMGVSVFIGGILAVRTWGHGVRLRQTAATVCDCHIFAQCNPADAEPGLFSFLSAPRACWCAGRLPE